MELKFKKLFQKNAQKLVMSNQKLRDKIDDMIIDFSKHLFASSYYRKSLKGIGNNIHELQIGGDIRVIIEIIIRDDVIVFLNI